jgi:leucyl aminopeptidase
LPIATEVTALAGLGPRPLSAYLSAVASGTAGPADLIAVPVEGDGVPAADPALDEFLPSAAADVASAFRLTGQPGEAADTAVRIADSTARVLFLGVGDRSPEALRRAGAELGRRIAGGRSAAATVVADEAQPGVSAFAEGILLGGYRFTLAARDADELARPGAVQLLAADEREQSAALSLAATLASAVALARHLGNEPSDRKSPQWLADAAAMATAGRDVQVRTWSEAELAQVGFGGILAVGSGSVRPPRLIELSYCPAGARQHVVLVGKGITFDSGGLSLKPTEGMQLMKTDMAGGAAIIAVASALASLGIGCRVTGLVAAAENMPSGSAYRPGDVITQYGGRTVEVLNTDAEGRLVLADALAYAAATLQPDLMVDVATLTGAARIALGTSHAALYATDDGLADGLIAAGLASGDRLWRMPLEGSYARALESPVADLSHVARDGSPAGSILAALFLREFAGDCPWAHLDIAGAGRSATDAGEFSKGATGFGTRLLLRWLAGL